MKAVLKYMAVLVVGVVAAFGSASAMEEKMPGVQWMIGAGFEVEGVIPEMRSMLVGLGQPITYRAEVLESES